MGDTSCDALPREYQAEALRLCAVAGPLRAELKWETATAVFNAIAGKAMCAAADGFGREASAGNFQPATARHALVCACVRIVSATDKEGAARTDLERIVTEEYEGHLLEVDNDDPTLVWDTLAAEALGTLEALWRQFYEQVVGPGMPAREVTGHALSTWLVAMFVALAPHKRYVHYYGPIADDPAQFHTAVAPVLAALHREFWRLVGTPTQHAVLVHKTEAAERMSEMYLCDPFTVADYLTELERRGSVRWPMCMVQLHAAFSGFTPPAGGFITNEQRRIRQLCRARAAVVRALAKPYPSIDAHQDSVAIVQYMDTVVFALLLVVECLGHTCFPASNPYDMVFLRAAVGALPTELFRYWKQCLPALLAGNVAAYEAAMDAKFTAKWRALIRASVRVEGHPERLRFDVHQFLAATARKRLAAGAAAVKCTDSAWPTWTAGTYRIVSNVFPEDASTCGSPCAPLLHLPPSVDKHLAFAPPSPRLLFTKVYGQEANVESKWVDAFAMLWRAAYTARRECEPLAELACHAPVITRRGKRAKVVMDTVPCYACGTAHAPSRDACAQHPLCLQCYLTFKESQLMDLLLQQGGGSTLTACAAPDCAHEHSLTELHALLPCEMRTVLHMVQQPRPVMACAYCGHDVSGTGEPEHDPSVLRECTLCRMQTCTQCLGLAHPGQVCSMVYLREAGKTPATILSEAKMQLCPGCAVPSVKAEGCNHMTCVCGTHWCWLCACTVDAKDPAAHFTDVTGGDAAARCKMQQYSAASEVARMVAAITRRADISEELKAHCIDAVTGKQRTGDMTQAAADL